MAQIWPSCFDNVSIMNPARQSLLLATACATLFGYAHMSLIPCAYANEANSVAGLAVIHDPTHLQINGQRLALWGIDALAPDQQCWQDGAAWGCGEEALMALKHYADGKNVRCDIQSAADKEGPAFAKCYRLRGSREQDIAEHMVRHGWALDRGVQSGGAYYNAEQEAQSKKTGAWQGRFQTAQDWKEGIQRFVGEEDVTTSSPDEKSTPETDTD